MTKHDATEQAYHNGYYKGKAEAEENAAKEIAKLTAERDAPVAALAELQVCSTCKNYRLSIIDEPCASCNKVWFNVNKCKWEWKGTKHD